MTWDLGKLGITRKISKVSDSRTECPSPFENSNFGNTGQNLRKGRSQSFLMLSNFP